MVIFLMFMWCLVVMYSGIQVLKVCYVGFDRKCGMVIDQKFWLCMILVQFLCMIFLGVFFWLLRMQVCFFGESSFWLCGFLQNSIYRKNYNMFSMFIIMKDIFQLLCRMVYIIRGGVYSVLIEELMLNQLMVIDCFLVGNYLVEVFMLLGMLVVLVMFSSVWKKVRFCQLVVSVVVVYISDQVSVKMLKLILVFIVLRMQLVIGCMIVQQICYVIMMQEYCWVFMFSFFIMVGVVIDSVLWVR